jgi:hypothetical protein
MFEYRRAAARTAYNSNVMRETTWWLLAAGNKPCMLKSRWGLNFITIRKNIFPRDPTRNSVFQLDILVICRVSCHSSAKRYPSYPVSLSAWFSPSGAVACQSNCSSYRNKYSRSLNNLVVTVTRLPAGQPSSSSIRCKGGYIFVLSRVTIPSVRARPASSYSVGTKSCFIGDKGTGREVDRSTLIKFQA